MKRYVSYMPKGDINYRREELFDFMVNGVKTSYNRLLNALKAARDEKCRVTFDLRLSMLMPNVSRFHLEGNIARIVENEGFEDEDVMRIYLGDRLGSCGVIDISSKSGLFEKSEDNDQCYFFDITYRSDFINTIVESIIAQKPQLNGFQNVGHLEIKIWSAY